MKKWQKATLTFGLISSLGALGLWAGFGDGCPSGCPMHPGRALTSNTVEYNPDGTVKSAKCGFACGCSFTNNGGNGGGNTGPGKKHVASQAAPIDKGE